MADEQEQQLIDMLSAVQVLRESTRVNQVGQVLHTLTVLTGKINICLALPTSIKTALGIESVIGPLTVEDTDNIALVAYVLENNKYTASCSCINAVLTSELPAVLTAWAEAQKACEEVGKWYGKWATASNDLVRTERTIAEET